MKKKELEGDDDNGESFERLIFNVFRHGMQKKYLYTAQPPSGYGGKLVLAMECSVSFVYVRSTCIRE
jgi:hypothetical protein